MGMTGGALKWKHDATPYNATLFKNDGGVVALHSDSANTIQRMYTEAAKIFGMARQRSRFWK